MKIDILTLFPEMFAPLEHSIVGKAKEKDYLTFTTITFEIMLKKLVMWMTNPMVGAKACY